MKKTTLLLFTSAGILTTSLQAQVTKISAEYDTTLSFWGGLFTNQSANKQAWTNNSAYAPAATEAQYQQYYDYTGMVVRFDLSGVTLADVQGPEFVAYLDVMFHGFAADKNVYSGSNPDPLAPDGGEGDGVSYLDVYRVITDFEDTANRFMANPSSGSFLNWDGTVPTSLPEAYAEASNFGASADFDPASVDEFVFVYGWGWSEEVIAVDLTSSALMEWAPGAGPVHLGKSGVFSASSPGTSMDDVGSTIIGDGVVDQNFGLVLAFDTTSTFQTKVSDGERVILRGSTLFSVDDGSGGMVQKTIGDLSWADLMVTVQGYGNSLEGTFGDDPVQGNASRTAAAGNLDPADTLTNATYEYTVGPALTFAADPFVEDASFEIDLTSIVSAIALSDSVDRIMVGIFARKDGDGTGTGFVGSDGQSDADRIAFYASSFELVAGRLSPADATNPNHYGEMVWNVTSLVQDWVTEGKTKGTLFIHMDKAKSWGEQVNMLTMEEDNRPPDVVAAGDAAPMLRMGIVPVKPPISGVVADPDFLISVETQAGYYYQLQFSSDGMVSWNDSGDSVEGDGSPIQFTGSAPGAPGEKVFYRVTASIIP